MKSLTCNEIDTIAKHLYSYGNDKKLVNCELVLNNKGKPWAISGGQCRVYKVVQKDGAVKALRFWNTILQEAEERCSAISSYLSSCPSSYFLSFEYLNNAFKYNGETFPVILMDWSPAISLKRYIKNNLNNKNNLKRLQEEFVALITFLHDHKISHGDLHHDNIRVNPNGSLVLIDYDSLFVPPLNGYNDNCNGYSGYQHPIARTHNIKLSPKADYFSELIIYLSIEALIEDSSLWDKYSIEQNDQSFILSINDFLNLKSSAIYKELSGKTERLSILLKILVYYLNLKKLDDLLPFYEVPSILGVSELTTTKNESIFCTNCGNKFISHDDLYCIICGCKRV